MTDAIFKSKMAAGYHGDSDGYLALNESPYSKVPICKISCFYHKTHNSYDPWLLLPVLFNAWLTVEKNIAKIFMMSKTDFLGQHFHQY